MTSVLYSVLILNFNVARFAQRAIRSVLDHATTDRFTVQVVDNSSTACDSQLLEVMQSSRVFALLRQDNRGFAVGYNTAARVAFSRDRPAYFVIMNPDIELTQQGTVEQLIERLRGAGLPTVGVQPLVWDYRFAEQPESRQAIRRVPDYWDLVVCESVVLRYVFRNRFRKFTMANVGPEFGDVAFDVPSGAFFVIDARVFMNVGGFDENTFLYGEEFILGKKLRDKGLRFLLAPTITVKHYQGASTGFEYRAPLRGKYRHRMSSHIYYARRYLGAGHAKLVGLRIAMEVGFAVRVLAWLFGSGTGGVRKALLMAVGR